MAPHEELLRMVLRGDREAARAAIDDLLRAGTTTESVLIDVLAAVQSEVGRRWEADECTVADEHTATAVVDALLAELAMGAVAEQSAGEIVVVCAEGEWHVLTARLVAELLRRAGHRVRFAGGSVPADHLRRYLTDDPPVAVCLSCSRSRFIPGALRSIEAAHQAGVPVIAGGRGLGTDDHVALRIGADTWAATADDAHQTVAAWSEAPPRHLAPLTADIGRWSAFELARPALRTGASRRIPEGPARDLVDDTLAVLSAAVLVDDQRVFAEFSCWLEGVVQARPSWGVAGTEIVRAVADEVAAQDPPCPQVSELIRVGLPKA